MAASRVIASRLRCSACRTNFPRSLASSAGLDISANGVLRPRPSSRAFTTAPLRLSDALSREESRQADQELDSSADAPNTQVESVPWYLQVDAPEPLATAAHPFGERARIPALPEHPPPMLAGFLQHVSVELGIDDLVLLDLRHLDPPPALGGSLLMLLGTTRSEKHLHVSADKLCRWLRSEHKLSPHADGLLGRNELKLKLRRKARKARMLSHAGASEGSLAADDGIRSDWICVNVGTVEAADSAPRPVRKTEGFVGFGGGPQGVNIVLQLFTEEKRAALDLETLWNGVMKTDRRNKEARTPEDMLEQLKDESRNPNGAVFADNGIATTSYSASRNDPQTPLQARAYHTTSARQYGMRSGLSRAGERPWANMWLRTRGASMSTRSDPDTHPVGNAPSQLEQLARPDQQPSAIGLTELLEQLHRMSEDEKLKALGEGPHTSGQTTPFLEDFFSYIPAVPDVSHYNAIMQLYLAGVSINHPGYPIELVSGLLKDMQSSCVAIPEQMFLEALRAMLSCQEFWDWKRGTNATRYYLAFWVLQGMEAYSYPTLTDEIITMLFDSVSTLRNELEAQVEDPEVIAIKTRFQREKRSELLRRIEMLALPLKASTFLHMLQRCAILGDMEGMWHVWVSTALAMHPRSPEMYATVLNGVAFTNNEKECIQALRDLVPQMEFETPPVSLGRHVGDAVKRCLLVVKPDVDKVWDAGDRSREWEKLWDRVMYAQKGVSKEMWKGSADSASESHLF